MPSLSRSAPATAPINPSPPNATATRPASAAPRASSRACSRLSVNRVSHSAPPARSAACTPGSCAPGAPAAGVRVDDQRERPGHEPSTSSRERRRDRHRCRLRGGRRRAGVGDAGQDDGPVEAGRGRAGEVGVQAVPDDERAPGCEPVERGEKRLGLRFADAPRPNPRGVFHGGHQRAGTGARALRGGERRVAAGGEHVGAGRARRGWRCAARRNPARRGRRVPRVTRSASASVPLTIRWPESATWRNTAGDPITYVVVRGRSASTCWSAAPAVTTSAIDAWTPSPHSLRTYSSGARRASLVTNAIPIPCARSAAIA